MLCAGYVLDEDTSQPTQEQSMFLRHSGNKDLLRNIYLKYILARYIYIYML